MKRDRYDDLIDQALGRLDRQEGKRERLRRPEPTKRFFGERYLDFFTRNLRVKFSIGTMVLGAALTLNGSDIACEHAQVYEAQLVRNVDSIVDERNIQAEDIPAYDGPSLDSAMYQGLGGLVLLGVGGITLLTRTRERSVEYDSGEQPFHSIADKGAIQRREYT